jgi:predicted transposase YdaD
MTRKTNRSSDEAFLQLMTVSGSSVLKLLGFPPDQAENYQFRAVVLKEKRLEPDVEGFPVLEGADGRVFIEFQGYKDPYIRYRLLAKALFACAQEKYPGPVRAAIIYTDPKYRAAALSVNAFAGLAAGTEIQELDLTDYPEEKLSALDRKLVVLAPFTLPATTAKATLLVKGSEWKAELERAFPESQQPDALNILGLFILNKFRKLSYQEVMTMLRFDLRKSLAGRQVYQMGEQQGAIKGAIKNAQQMVLEALEERFGTVPRELIDQVRTIKQPEALRSLLRQTFRCQTLESFQEMLSRVTN